MGKSIVASLFIIMCLISSTSAHGDTQCSDDSFYFELMREKGKTDTICLKDIPFHPIDLMLKFRTCTKM
jgi:hypothetical protein